MEAIQAKKPDNHLLKRKLNGRLINIIEESIPSGEKSINVLMKVLGLKRDSAYRRIHGEVGFTLEELFLLQKNFGFSFDNILTLEKSEPPSDCSSPVSTYLSHIDANIRLYSQLCMEKNRRLIWANKSIPEFLYFPFDALSDFRFLYSVSRFSPEKYIKLREISIPETYQTRRENYLHLWNKIEHVDFILIKEFFSPFVNELLCFRELGLIGRNDFNRIKQDLYEMLSLLEEIIETGSYPGSEQQMNVYVSDMEVTPRFYGENAQRRFTGISVHSMIVPVENEHLCNMHKSWLDTMMSLSTPITEGADTARSEFLETQRKIISVLG